MRVWKIEASLSEERHPSRWGFALAETADTALAMCKATSGMPFNFVHEKHPEMFWPGRIGGVIDWS